MIGGAREAGIGVLNFLDILSRPEKSAREPAPLNRKAWRSIIQISSCAESRFSFLSAKMDDVNVIFLSHVRLTPTRFISQESPLVGFAKNVTGSVSFATRMSGVHYYNRISCDTRSFSFSNLTPSVAVAATDLLSPHDYSTRFQMNSCVSRFVTDCNFLFFD